MAELTGHERQLVGMRLASSKLSLYRLARLDRSSITVLLLCFRGRISSPLPK